MAFLLFTWFYRQKPQLAKTNLAKVVFSKFGPTLKQKYNLWQFCQNNEVNLSLDVIPEDRLVCYVPSLTPVRHNTDSKFFNGKLKYGEKQFINVLCFRLRKSMLS